MTSRQLDSPASSAVVRCVYCDTDIADTRDHVIPRCLFVPPYPASLITVPACRECNERKAIDDSFFRDYLTLDFAGSTSPAAETLLHGKVRRAVARNRSELGRTVLRSSTVEPFYTKGGIYLGDFAQAPVDDARFVPLFRRIIRGLYFHYTNERIPLTYPVEVHRIMPWDFEQAFRSFSQLHFNPCGPMANVFAGGCARVSEEPLSTMWLLTFYERVHFHVTAFDPSLASRFPDAE